MKNIRFYIMSIVVLTMLFAYSCKAQKNVEKIPAAAAADQDEKNRKIDIPQNTGDVQDEKKLTESKNSSCDFSSYKASYGRPLTQFEFIPQPRYTKKMRRFKGEVTIQVLVNKDGQVEKACIVSGNRTLAESARQAAMNIRINADYSRKILTSLNYDYFEFPVVYQFK